LWRPKPQHDRRPRVPRHRLCAYLPSHPTELAQMAHKRAQQRWSALLTRIAQHVCSALGDDVWAVFVAHAKTTYKAAFVRTFRKPTLRCVGPPHGAPCPHAFRLGRKV